MTPTRSELQKSLDDARRALDDARSAATAEGRSDDPDLQAQIAEHESSIRAFEAMLQSMGAAGS